MYFQKEFLDVSWSLNVWILLGFEIFMIWLIA